MKTDTELSVTRLVRLSSNQITVDMLHRFLEQVTTSNISASAVIDIRVSEDDSTWRATLEVTG